MPLVGIIMGTQLAIKQKVFTQDGQEFGDLTNNTYYKFEILQYLNRVNTC